MSWRVGLVNGLTLRIVDVVPVRSPVSGVLGPRLGPLCRRSASGTLGRSASLARCALLTRLLLLLLYRMSVHYKLGILVEQAYLIVTGIWVCTLLTVLLGLVIASLVASAPLRRLGFAVLDTQDDQQILGEVFGPADLVLGRCPGLSVLPAECCAKEWSGRYSRHADVHGLLGLTTSVVLQEPGSEAFDLDPASRLGLDV